MLKIVDKRSIDTHFKKFGDLEPGTVFQFRNETNPNRFYLRTKNHQTFGGMICAAIPLFGDFEETVSMYDSEVLVIWDYRDWLRLAGSVRMSIPAITSEWRRLGICRCRRSKL